MKKNRYLKYVQTEHCLPDDALETVVELIQQELPYCEYLNRLYEIARTCYRTDPGHARYDANRSRFPYPNDADLEAARRIATASKPLMSCKA